MYKLERDYDIRRQEARNQLFPTKLEDTVDSVNKETPFWLRKIRVTEIMHQYADKYGVVADAKRREV